ncbi:MAG: hypothetical protein KME64_29775 [Scytonematopsis contorta HA4267-MV1]|nr:hypothetical protein [Scytonematopsis contorta HA4267-MV1]
MQQLNKASKNHRYITVNNSIFIYKNTPGNVETRLIASLRFYVSTFLHFYVYRNILKIKYVKFDLEE